MDVYEDSEDSLRKIADEYERSNICPSLCRTHLLRHMALSLECVTKYYKKGSFHLCRPFCFSLAACAQSVVLGDSAFAYKLNPGIPWDTLSRLGVILDTDYHFNPSTVFGGAAISTIIYKGLPKPSELEEIVAGCLGALGLSLEELSQSVIFQQRVPILSELRALDDCISFPLKRQLFDVVMGTFTTPGKVTLETVEDRVCFIRRLAILGEILGSVMHGLSNYDKNIVKVFVKVRNAVDHFETEFVLREPGDRFLRPIVVWLKCFIKNEFTAELAALTGTSSNTNANTKTDDVPAAIFKIARDSGVLPNPIFTDAFLNKHGTMDTNILSYLSLNPISIHTDREQRTRDYDSYFFSDWITVDKIQFLYEFQHLRSLQPLPAHGSWFSWLFQKYTETEKQLVGIAENPGGGPIPVPIGRLNKKNCRGQTLKDLEFYMELFFGDDPGDADPSNDFQWRFHFVKVQHEHLRSRAAALEAPYLRNDITAIEVKNLVAHLILEIYNVLEYKHRLEAFTLQKTTSASGSEWLTLNEVYWRTVSKAGSKNKLDGFIVKWEGIEPPPLWHQIHPADDIPSLYKFVPYPYEDTLLQWGKCDLTNLLQQEAERVTMERNAALLAIEHFTVITGAYVTALFDTPIFFNIVSQETIKFLEGLRAARGYMAHNTLTNMGRPDGTKTPCGVISPPQLLHTYEKEMFLSLPELVVRCNELTLQCNPQAIDECKQRCNEYFDAHQYGPDYNNTDDMAHLLQRVADHKQDLISRNTPMLQLCHKQQKTGHYVFILA